MSALTISTRSLETVRQARTWQEYRAHYAGLGLCERCAAQAAYGHQHGFSQVRPPCWECHTVLALFPKQELNGWRSHSPDVARRNGTAPARVAA